MSSAPPSSAATPPAPPKAQELGTGANAASLELRETLAKYKRVTSRLKEVLEDTKQKLTAKEAECRSLPSALWQLLAAAPDARVTAHALVHVDSDEWVYAAAAAPSGSSAAPPRWAGWVFKSDLLRHKPGLSLPVQLSAEEAANLRAAVNAAQASEASIKEEFRKYRIRSETLSRQKDDDIEALHLEIRSLHHQSPTTGASSTDAAEGGSDVKLADAQDKITKLLRAKADLQEKESQAQELRLSAERELQDLQDRFASLEAEVTRLRQVGSSDVSTGPGLIPGAGASPSVGAPGGASHAPGPGSAASSSGTGTPASGATGPVSSSGNVGSTGDAGAGPSSEFVRVQTEYTTYRKRAMEVLKEKEEQIQQLSAQLRATKGHARRDSVPVSDVGDSASVRTGSVDLFASEATREYLKNILLRYMSTNDPAVKAQLEAAIAAVVELTPAEISRVKAARERAAASSGGLWSLIGR